MNTGILASYAPAAIGMNTPVTPQPGTPEPLPGAPVQRNPTPFPGKPADALLETPLVLFTGTWAQNGTSFSITHKAGGRTLTPPTKKDNSWQAAPRTLVPAGQSFQEAVTRANERARIKTPNTTAGIYFHAAQAVLQASDGAWYVTALRDMNAPNTWIQIGTDPRETNNDRARMSSLSITPLNPAVKAVVGAYNWVNFTDEKYTPKFADTPAA